MWEQSATASSGETQPTQTRKGFVHVLTEKYKIWAETQQQTPTSSAPVKQPSAAIRSLHRSSSNVHRRLPEVIATANRQSRGTGSMVAKNSTRFAIIMNGYNVTNHSSVNSRESTLKTTISGSILDRSNGDRPQFLPSRNTVSLIRGLFEERIKQGTNNEESSATLTIINSDNVQDDVQDDTRTLEPEVDATTEEQSSSTAVPTPVPTNNGFNGKCDSSDSECSSATEEDIESSSAPHLTQSNGKEPHSKKQVSFTDVVETFEYQRYYENNDEEEDHDDDRDEDDDDEHVPFDDEQVEDIPSEISSSSSSSSSSTPTSDSEDNENSLHETEYTFAMTNGVQWIDGEDDCEVVVDSDDSTDAPKSGSVASLLLHYKQPYDSLMRETKNDDNNNNNKIYRNQPAASLHSMGMVKQRKNQKDSDNTGRKANGNITSHLTRRFTDLTRNNQNGGDSR